MQVDGLVSLNGRTVQTKTQLRELIKNAPETVQLVPVSLNYGPGEVAAKGPADTLPKEIHFVAHAWNHKWSAAIYHGKNGLTVK